MRNTASARALSTALLCFVLAVPKLHATPIPGDVNGDGAITSVDVTLIRDHILFRAPLTSGPLSRADGNQDNNIEVSDVVWTSQRLGTTIEMVTVPPGTFTMGRRDDGDDASGDSSELPRHDVALSTYQIGKYLVTNSQYCEALNWANARGKIEVISELMWRVVYAEGRPILALDDGYGKIDYSSGTFRCKTAVGIDWTTFSIERHPVVDVSWYGAIAFCNWISERDGLTPCYDLSATTWTLTPPYPNGYRLPTEAEWERAAAWDGAKHWIYGFRSDSLAGDDRCNYKSVYNGAQHVNPFGLWLVPYTSPVGWFNGTTVSPNGGIATVNSPSPVGCYDMSGNVWEWCQDWYHSDYSGAPANGSAWETQPSDYPLRVIRGGAWECSALFCRSAIRMGDFPEGGSCSSNGFRLARTP